MDAAGFPPPDFWPPNGPLAIGGPLSVGRLLEAYRRGIFPWPIDESPDGLWWWSPDPRAVLDPLEMHVPRRLARTLRQGRFTVSFDRAFEAVVRLCSSHRDRDAGTWITPQILRAYTELHAIGRAHSAEVWREGRLVGGLYGVAIGGMFAGESMVALERDASKVALVATARRVAAGGCRLFDVQLASDHLATFGAREIPRDEFLRRLATAIERPDCWRQ